MVSRIQKRRRYYFLLTILIPCLLLFLLLPWQAVLVLLILLSIFLAGPLDALWKLFQRWPSPPMPVSSSEEERPSYQQGYQEVYYQPSVPTVQPLAEDQPQAQYPQQYH